MANIPQLRERKHLYRPELDEEGRRDLKCQAQYYEIDRLIQQAEILAQDAPDSAALLLDGLLWRLASLAIGPESICAAPDKLLMLVEAREPAWADQLRLALRAPSVEARIFQARRCLQCLVGAPAASAR